MLALLLLSALQLAGDFERAARTPGRFVDVSCVLYDRADGQWCEDQAADLLPGAGYRPADLEALSKHSDARVRTLALIAIARLRDPKLLPLVMPLTRDTAGTYPAHLMVAHTLGIDGNVPTQAQTVGDVAEAIVRFYLEPAGYAYGSRHDGECPGFDDYWQQRKDRTALASWFTVQLYRASQRTTPIPPGREVLFANLRRSVEQLTGDQRRWYTLHVGSSEAGDRVFTIDETLAAARAIGADQLMAMLDGKAPSFDPDLVRSGRPASCGGQDPAADMRRFVLENSEVLLRSADADALLGHPDAKLALWSIAAAAVAPERADAILKPRIAALDPRVFGWDQAQMAAALVRLGGDVHASYALDWFYDRKPGEPITNAQEIFVGDVLAWPGSRGRALLRQLIEDGRFEDISAPALRKLIVQINAWLPSPLIERPYDNVPNEAETHAEWRRRVRGSVAKWMP